MEIPRKASASVRHVARRGPWIASVGVERVVDCRWGPAWEKKMVGEKFREAITWFEFGKTRPTRLQYLVAKVLLDDPLLIRRRKMYYFQENFLSK